MEDQRIGLEIKQCKEKITAAKKRIIWANDDELVKLRARMQKEEVITVTVASLCKSVPSFCNCSNCVAALHSRDMCSETKP